MYVKDNILRSYGLIMVKHAVEVIKAGYSLKSINNDPELKICADKLGLSNPVENKRFISRCNKVLKEIDSLGIKGSLPCGVTLVSTTNNYFHLARYIISDEAKGVYCKNIINFSPLVLKGFFLCSSRDKYVSSVLTYLQDLDVNCDDFLNLAMASISWGIPEDTYKNSKLSTSVVYAMN